jgi:hypothetical protein
MRAVLPGWLLVLLVAPLAGASPLPRKCIRPAEQLYRYSRSATVTDLILQASYKLVMDLPPKCTKGDVITEIDGAETNLGTVTRLFARVCQKSPSATAAEYFVKYRIANWESADEEFSLALERVFVSKPSAMLALLRKQPDSVRVQLLNDIVWGFLTNRTYGPTDPFEESGVKRLRPGEKLPQEVLNRKNYKIIFINLHPDMRKLWETYEKEINYILGEAGKYLETWGVEY